MWSGLFCALFGVLVTTAAFMTASLMGWLPPPAEDASTEVRVVLGLMLFGAALILLGVRSAMRSADEA